jgi:hypothetical protein
MRHFVPGTPDARLVGMESRAVARRDASWQAGDVMSPGPAPPGRRFILGAQSGDRLLVWYESGGIAHMYHLAVFNRRGGAWSLSRHLAEGSLPALCRRLDGNGASAYDQYW